MVDVRNPVNNGSNAEHNPARFAFRRQQLNSVVFIFSKIALRLADTSDRYMDHIGPGALHSTIYIQ